MERANRARETESEYLALSLARLRLLLLAVRHLRLPVVSGVRGQGSGVRGQGSGVRGQGSGVALIWRSGSGVFHPENARKSG